MTDKYAWVPFKNFIKINISTEIKWASNGLFLFAGIAEYWWLTGDSDLLKGRLLFRYFPLC